MARSAVRMFNRNPICRLGAHALCEMFAGMSRFGFVRFCSLRVVLPALVAGSSAIPCGAQRLPSARLVIDNDFIAIRNGGAQDQDYTSGIRIDLAWITRRRETRDPTRACCQLGLSLGQEMYTPRLDGPEPLPGERAYAAWLFVEPSYTRATQRLSNVVALRVGWIGPLALGEQAQNSIHQLINSEHHVGWKHQARIGPAYLLSYRATILAPLHLHAPAIVLQPSARFATGNVETSLEAGADAWLGQTSLRSSPGPLRPGKFYALVGTRGVFKFWDALLRIDPDGPAGPVARRPLIAELAAGCGYGAQKWAVEYRYFVRTTEYATQVGPHQYGSLRFSVFPGR